jgi:hypothetical protein
MERWAESQKLQSAMTRAAVAIACGLGGAKPEDFLGQTSPERQPKQTWQDQQAMFSGILGPPKQAIQ